MSSKGKFKCVLLMGLIILISLIIPTNLTFALEGNESSKLGRIILSDKETMNTLDEYSLLVSPLSDPIPSLAKVDWGILLNRSSFSNKSGGTMIYHNNGNASTARAEFSRIGGPGEITSYVNGNKITHVKQTDGGYLTLYTSTSSTLGAQRPTLTFGNDKVRFIGN
ncbi:hypothetical protein FC756_06095 [Lysinibacillus mangiferihumi]|uniref:Uncharacterized protein n=1 Tax=Lysinibacillus mangiferihumi TaxID=1130819 RepID=A0A4U2ZAI5_9BACI|nr:hypothetical protein [Lysinibacillus mangiferihumi]TKI71378.1 hypothetical protein FC756_06095 [Lysinibacillus mangiferihumi]